MGAHCGIRLPVKALFTGSGLPISSPCSSPSGRISALRLRARGARGAAGTLRAGTRAVQRQRRGWCSCTAPLFGQYLPARAAPAAVRGRPEPAPCLGAGKGGSKWRTDTLGDPAPRSTRMAASAARQQRSTPSEPRGRANGGGSGSGSGGGSTSRSAAWSEGQPARLSDLISSSGPSEMAPSPAAAAPAAAAAAAATAFSNGGSRGDGTRRSGSGRRERQQQRRTDGGVRSIPVSTLLGHELCMGCSAPMRL